MFALRDSTSGLLIRSFASDVQCRFSALSAPFAPPFRWFCETISHPLLSTHFLSWVKLWVKTSVHPKTILCK